MLERKNKFTIKRMNKTLYMNSEQRNFFNNKVSLIVDSLVDSHKLNKREFLQKIFNAAFKLIPEAEKGSFYELNGDKYIPIFLQGYDYSIIKSLELSVDEAFNDYECSSFSDIDAYEVHISERNDSRYSEETIEIFKKLGTYTDFTCLYAPIHVNGMNLGVICLDNFNKTGFSKMSKKILKFYAQLISNFYAEKINRENETKKNQEIVTALISAIEIKDIYTEGHAKRVKDYSIALARELNLSEELIKDIGTAAILHDVGKIGIPNEILIKKGKLTEEEYEIIKEHPLYTKKDLEKISGFGKIVNYAYHHHERYDGHGYPEGLKGDEIPFPAQIIQLADSYDAITSKRSYRDAKTSEEALEIIKIESGKQFNPEIVGVALRVFGTHKLNNEA
ncbi:HD-GYP domain-containing protein [Clostridium paridis]|nr:HD-GYP domain-containing protein [Clostridium paridis]